MRRVPLLVAVLAIALTAPVTASAAPAWLPPVDLSAGGQNAGSPWIAVDGAGNVIAVWTRNNGSENVVQAAIKPAGAAFGEPFDLSEPGQNATSGQVAFDGAGNAIAAWRRFDGLDNVVQAAVRPPGGTFGPTEDVSVSGESANELALAVSRGGDAVLAWVREDASGDGIVQASIRPAGGGFGAPDDLSAPGADAFDPHVALDPAGNATAVWTREVGADNLLQEASRPAGGSFGTDDDVSATGETAIYGHVAMDGTGGATVVWTSNDGSSAIVQAAAKPAGGSFGAVEDVSATDPTATRPVVGLDNAGNAVAVWESSGATTLDVLFATRGTSGEFGDPAPLSTPGVFSFSPHIAVDAAGTAFAIWEQSDGSNNLARAAIRPAGGSFEAADDLSQPGADADNVLVATDGAGNAAAVWQRSDGSDQRAQVAVYDATQPVLSAVTVPATGVVGVPVAFAATAFDAWSPVAATWAFGDGATGDGAAPSHTYTTPGTYDVAVTAADQAANTAVANGQIAIAPAAGPPPPPAVTAAVTNLRVRPSAFLAAARGASVAQRRRAPTGAAVSHRLNAAATVAFTVHRRRAGRRVGRRCVRPTRRNRSRRRCTRHTAVRGGFTRASTAGENAFRFTGRLGGRKLRRGRYRLTATPSVSGVRGTRARTTFRILRRSR